MTSFADEGVQLLLVVSRTRASKPAQGSDVADSLLANTAKRGQTDSRTSTFVL